MEFIVIGYDYKDEESIKRRMNVRSEHLKNADKMFKEEKLIFASALLNEKGEMNGSVMAVDFPTEDELRKKWLDNEPYITGKVWQEIIVAPAKFAKH